MSHIHVERWGSTGPRVILVHGGVQGTSSAGHRNWRAQSDLGGQGWQLLVPDRPGHGNSPDPGRPDDAVADAEWVSDMAAEAGAGGAHLVGHSFGGLITLAAAARNPGAVKSLTLIEPALFKIATKAPAVKKIVLGLALSMLIPASPANKARKAMALLGIPDEFALDENDHASLGKALAKAKFPSKSATEGYLRTVREAGIPLLILSGSNAAFRAAGEIVAEKGTGSHIAVTCEHHFPQWAGASFNDMLTEHWRKGEMRS